MENSKGLIGLQKKIRFKELELLYIEGVLKALGRVGGCFEGDKEHFLYSRKIVVGELENLLMEEAGGDYEERI